MQSGTLTAAQQALFLAAQAASLREPSFAVWIAGIDDPSPYIIDIDTETQIQSARGRGYLNIGYGILRASNEDDTFYSGGKSQLEANAAIKIWAGFDSLNVPIFSGVVLAVEPAQANDIVILRCMGYMGLFRELRVDGSQGTNNTIKLILENFCSQIGVVDDIPSTDETAETLSQPTFEPQTMLAAVEECCDCLFSIGIFDEDGTFQLYEREYSNYVDWVFTDDNVLSEGVTVLAPTEIINRVEVEYRENFLAVYKDQGSIDSYHERNRRLRRLLLNSTEVASKTTGSTLEEINHDYEGFQFTSAAGVANIDCIAVWMYGISAAGPMTLSIYSDVSGSPESLVGTSLIKRAEDVASSGSGKTFFSFLPPVAISPSTDYWGILDASNVTGTLYFRISAAEADNKHAYTEEGGVPWTLNSAITLGDAYTLGFFTDWAFDDDKQVMFIAQQSLPAQRVAEDLIRFNNEPHERIRIAAPAAPHLQCFDEVMVDITAPFSMKGRYVIEGRRHKFGPDENGRVTYKTIDTLRKRG